MTPRECAACRTKSPGPGGWWRARVSLVRADRGAVVRYEVEEVLCDGCGREAAETMQRKEASDGI